VAEQPAPSWQPPEPQAGPAPGVAFGEFGPRLLAYLIDVLIVIGIIIAVWIGWAIVASVTGGRFGGTSGAAAAFGFLAFLVTFGLGLVYFPWFWTHGGATPGMRNQGLRVVRDDNGGPITTGQAILRLIGFWVSGAVLYLGYIWILFDKRRRGWHDLIAGTVVVQKL
jgi:uncharacterized RDD family membrane protein YckC